MAKAEMAVRLGDSLRFDYERRGTRMNGISLILSCTARTVRHLVSERQTDVSTLKTLLSHPLRLAKVNRLMANIEK